MSYCSHPHLHTQSTHKCSKLFYHFHRESKWQILEAANLRQSRASKVRQRHTSKIQTATQHSLDKAISSSSLLSILANSLNLEQRRLWLGEYRDVIRHLPERALLRCDASCCHEDVIWHNHEICSYLLQVLGVYLHSSQITASYSQNTLHSTQKSTQQFKPQPNYNHTSIMSNASGHNQVCLPLRKLTLCKPAS